MLYYIETRNSTYVLDEEEMTWERICVSQDSGALRTDGGELTKWPEIKVGESLILLGPPIAEHADGRIVFTSTVKKVCIYANSDSHQPNPQPTAPEWHR